MSGSSTGKGTRPPVARTLTYDTTLGTVIVGGLQSSTAAHQQQQQQHCPAIQKLMHLQRDAGGVGGVLQTVSESPENRLCDNGVPLEQHHHHHHLNHHHQQHHHHHLHHHQHQQLQPDPIKRLFQSHPPPPTSTSFSVAPSCCSIPPPLQKSPHPSGQPIVVDSVPCSHLQAQQSKQMFFSLPVPQPEVQHNNQSASAVQGTGR